MTTTKKIMRALLITVLVVINLFFQFFIAKYLIVIPFGVFIHSGETGVTQLLCIFLGSMIGLIGVSAIIALWILLVFVWIVIDEFL